LNESREPLRVLIATYGLTGYGGTDLYTRDLALALLKAGWLPVVYSTQGGRIADELRRATIPVVDHLDAVTAAPHVIHGHHILETVAALARFPEAPAVFVCHDAVTWHSLPPRSPRIAVYVAVDRNCRDRMMLEHRIPEESIRIIPNAVDLDRFARRASLPDTPRRALLFSNQAKENTWMAPIRSACEHHGIMLDVIGLGSGRYAENPERVLPGYDLVFGKARCALEAAATGAAVIVCDAAGLAGMVTSQNLDDFRQLNFGARTLIREVTRGAIEEEIARYDATDALAVSNRIRGIASADQLAADFVALYQEIRQTPVSVAPHEDLRAMGESLERLMPHLYRAAKPPSIPWRLLRWVANSKAMSPLARVMYRFGRKTGL
jgi:Glycosyltransferase Family 4